MLVQMDFAGDPPLQVKEVSSPARLCSRASRYRPPCTLPHLGSCCMDMKHASNSSIFMFLCCVQLIAQQLHLQDLRSVRLASTEWCRAVSNAVTTAIVDRPISHKTVQAVVSVFPCCTRIIFVGESPHGLQVPSRVPQSLTDSGPVHSWWDLPFVMLTAEQRWDGQLKAWKVTIKPHATAATWHTEDESRQRVNRLDRSPLTTLMKLPKHCRVESLLLSNSIYVEAKEVRGISNQGLQHSAHSDPRVFAQS